MIVASWLLCKRRTRTGKNRQKSVTEMPILQAHFIYSFHSRDFFQCIIFRKSAERDPWRLFFRDLDMATSLPNCLAIVCADFSLAVIVDIKRL